MGAILVYIQQHEGKVVKASLAALSAAFELSKVWNKSGVQALCLGPQARQAADEIVHYGVSRALYSENAALSKFTAASFAAMLKAGAEMAQADTLVCPATSAGKDMLATASALLQAGQASDIVGINADGSLKRPMYAGNVVADVTIETAIRCVSVRATAFQPAMKQSAAGNVEELAFVASAIATGEVQGYELSGGNRPELSEAEVVVSGGRALQSSENFQKYIFPLADALGAAVGASRAAVDSGYAPNDWQVGQTGKVVAPALYMAVGISGAIQHLAGMKDSKVIVAINKDPDAPIFEIADYGLVADLFQAIPVLTEAIKKLSPDSMGKVARLRKVNRFQGIVLLGLLLLGVVGAVLYSYVAERSKFFTVEFVLPGGTTTPSFALEVARTEPVRRKGLMFRKPDQISDKQGMLFVFPRETVQSFWMRNTYTSLDMIFINRALQVVGIVHSASVLNDEPRGVPQPSIYVVELRAGSAKQYGITEGAKLVARDSLPVALD